MCPAVLLSRSLTLAVANIPYDRRQVAARGREGCELQEAIRTDGYACRPARRLTGWCGVSQGTRLSRGQPADHDPTHLRGEPRTGTRSPIGQSSGDRRRLPIRHLCRVPRQHGRTRAATVSRNPRGSHDLDYRAHRGRTAPPPGRERVVPPGVSCVTCAPRQPKPAPPMPTNLLYSLSRMRPACEHSGRHPMPPGLSGSPRDHDARSGRGSPAVAGAGPTLTPGGLAADRGLPLQ
jgi:hypothetical protein